LTWFNVNDDANLNFKDRTKASPEIWFVLKEHLPNLDPSLEQLNELINGNNIMERLTLELQESLLKFAAERATSLDSLTKLHKSFEYTMKLEKDIKYDFTKKVYKEALRRLDPLKWLKCQTFLLKIPIKP